MKVKYTKLKVKQIKDLVRAFALGIPALQAADYAKVHRNTANKFFKRIRLGIAESCMKSVRRFKGEIELDESYFGGKRKGDRGRGAAGKQIVFGILKRNGRVRTIVVEDVSAQTLMKEIEDNTGKGSVYYTDSFRSYNSVSRFGKHYRVDHGHQFKSSPRSHINGIEGFWSYAKRFLRKYNGVSRKNFNLYLKEIEWRFNNRNAKDLSGLIRKMI